MNSLARVSRVSIVLGLLLIAVVIVMSGCSPDAEGALISPNLGPQLVLAQSEGVVEIAPTPAPPKLAELSTEEIYAGLDPALADAIANADISNGETLALTFACVGCHALDPNQVMTGPTWHNMGDTAVVRVPGESPALYLYQSIVEPGAFVVPNYPANIMPATFAQTMSEEQIATMVAYLLSLHGQE
ncbi:MAG: c-type cytochrome [Caldilineaceae bacterium]|nr:c-type cytochrome [Caldilineaceae bacterium]